MKLLIVDDDPVARSLSVRFLQIWGYEVVEASDGAEALEILDREPIQFVISDWIMPNLSGLDVCRKIRMKESAYYTYIILCTAKADKKAFIEGMEAGADDFLVKPFEKAELHVRVRAGERIVNLEQGLAQRNRDLVGLNAKLLEAHRQIESDLQAAAWMQASLLPKPSACILGISSEWRFRPSRYVAGDTLNIFPIDEHHVAFYILDVSGHGVPAAMLSVMLGTLLTPDNTRENPLKQYDEIAQRYVPVAPEVAVAELNRRFQSREDQYFTMIYGLLDTRDLVLRFCQAGHPHPLLLSGGSVVQAVGEGGPPVGILPMAEYESVQVQLKPGDRFLMYSDGVTECTNPCGELFGDSRMQASLARSCTQPLCEMFDGLELQMENWRGKREFEDDISLLAIEVPEKETI